MKIILIGFMGCGKSSVAKELKDLLNQPILEMDDLVLQKTQTKNMHEVFAKGEELLLRQTEVAIAQEYATATSMIISTGGGAVLNKSVLDYLKKAEGKIFFLNAAFQTLKVRLVGDASRPLFQNIDEAKALYQFRQSLYLKYADHIIEVDQKSVKEIAKEIAESS